MLEKHGSLPDKVIEQCPEYCNKSGRRLKKSKMKFICQCRFGHVFDYRVRIKFSLDDRHYAPCQGRCPVCGTTGFYFMSNDYK